MLLLDTNTLYWALTADPMIGRATRNLLSTPAPKYFSSLSILELQIKHVDSIVKGRRRFEVPENLTQKCILFGLFELPVKGEIAPEVSRLQTLIGHDPFDRMILAQAAKHNLRLLTADRELLSLGLDWVIDSQE